MKRRRRAGLDSTAALVEHSMLLGEHRRRMPKGAAARAQYVLELMNPRTAEACPTCGKLRVVQGKPLISVMTALKLLDLG